MMDAAGYLIVFHRTVGDPLAYDRTVNYFTKNGFERIHKTVYAKRCWTDRQIQKIKSELQKMHRKSNRFKFLVINEDQFVSMEMEAV